jgi:hypothetical protein
MALPEPKGHRIPLEEAVAQAKRYRDSMHKGGLFLRKELDELLAQPGCSAMRFYYGRNKQGADTLILVGVDREGNDMASGVVLDIHYPCPPFCNDESPLNQ